MKLVLGVLGDSEENVDRDWRPHNSRNQRFLSYCANVNVARLVTADREVDRKKTHAHAPRLRLQSGVHCVVYDICY